MKNIFKIFLIISIAFGSFYSVAQEDKPQSEALNLEELLDLVKAGKFAESEEATKRENRFSKEKNRQQTLLANAKAERAKLEAIATNLETRFEANDAKLTLLEEQLKTRLGSLYETFGHLQGVASDTEDYFKTAITSGQFGKEREKFLGGLAKKMGEGVSVATIEEIEQLWYELSRELVASGNVQRFSATVIDNDGESSEQDVVRVGNFNAVAEGQYLTYLSKRGAYETLPKQPGRYLDGTYDVFDEDSGFVQFAVDPTGPQGGALLVNLISLPSFFEQIQYGRITGYTIIVLFLIAIGVFGWRFYALFTINGNVKKQAAGEAAGDNPLSRIFAVADQNKTDTETLELKLSEQILIERAEIDQYIWVVRLISVISPLLGLFGTIIGMINTFQAITLFGTGDPKTMAGGISEALVTTMLGLMCAIPTTFMAAALSNYSKGILAILEEQSTGMVAVRSEETHSGSSI
ncbi:MAG: biopolymer transporter ExbB [Flavobacteriaceae bacterium]|jgi:biopolymer transport protein ExbB|nr:biopolymer transporter ExbB [Flavobacteriaceae bacterium]|tara:strand:- start:463 stop:1857 length:1395 start_codon:yes stop_codon:yes gene_type:complete